MDNQENNQENNHWSTNSAPFNTPIEIEESSNFGNLNISAEDLKYFESGQITTTHQTGVQTENQGGLGRDLSSQQNFYSFDTNNTVKQVVQVMDATSACQGHENMPIPLLGMTCPHSVPPGQYQPPLAAPPGYYQQQPLYPPIRGNVPMQNGYPTQFGNQQVYFPPQQPYYGMQQPFGQYPPPGAYPPMGYPPAAPQFQTYGAPPQASPSRNNSNEYKQEKSYSSESDGEKGYTREKSLSSPGKRSPNKNPSRPKIIQNPSELHSLGSFKTIPSTGDNYKLILKYALNSSGVSKGRIKIHSILELNSWSFSFFEQNNTLLWCKTTPQSVKKLASGDDGSVAFYDRIARALAVPSDELEKPFRQVILLCMVYLGNVHEHKNGYKMWIQRPLPNGKNSVQGIGRRVPHPEQSEVVKSTTVPCGRTTENSRYKSYELEYNEYIIYNHKQIRVKYAVDVEVFPGRKEGNGNASEFD